ncbi:MAG: hydrolase [Pseudomonadota bacterium]
MGFRLRDFGAYTVGGRLHHVSEGEPHQIAVTRDVTLTVDPRGHYAVEHAYVQYFIPEARRPGPAVVLLHGGGMCGTVWEGLPGERKGWLHLLLDRGYEVHVVDIVERGRAGFAPDLWDGAPVLRSMEDAWTLFRIGPTEGFATRTPFPDQRFPVSDMEALARLFVPRWLSTAALQQAALHALLVRLGGPIVICHSQGAETVFGAVAEGAPIDRIIAVEPSADPRAPDRFAGVPMVIAAGDHLDHSELWRGLSTRWQHSVATLTASGAHATILSKDTSLAPGHSHLPMLDAGHDDYLDACLTACGLSDR